MPRLKGSSLQQSWLWGAVGSAALVTPVKDARRVCNGNEADVRALRDSLQAVFEKWRDESGPLPVDSGVGLLESVNLYEGRALAKYPPYACMGNRWADYADLLAKLTAEQYPPLLKLEAKQSVTTPALPGDLPRLTVTQQGRQRILAALILSEAAAGKVEAAAKAHLELRLIQGENKRRAKEAMRAADKVIYRFAESGAKSHRGHKERTKDKDIVAFQKAAAPLFKANDYNIKKTLREPLLAEYVRKHYGEHTLRDALRKIRPEGAGPKGAPRKGNVMG